MTDKEKRELEVSSKKEIVPESGEPTREGVEFVPEVDILENEKAILLYADLPGVKKEDVDVDIREGVLTLTATVEQERDQDNLIYQEYEVGGFQRRFNLGDKIDQENIQASLKDGVLTLTLPKAAELQPRKIEIQA